MLKDRMSCRGTYIVPTAGSKQRGFENAGFSLIEVMIGVLVFSIGVLAIFSMQLSSVRGNSTARHYTEASTIGVDKMEDLIALPYTHGDLSNGEYGPVNDPSGRYTIFWNVEDDDLIERTKTVSVIILWSGAGMQRSVSLQRVIPEII